MMKRNIVFKVTDAVKKGVNEINNSYRTLQNTFRSIKKKKQKQGNCITQSK